MAARKGQNLLEQALRIAQGTGRSPQARVSLLLRLAVRSLGLSSASLYLPDHNANALTRRLSTLVPPAGFPCQIPLGFGCAGRAAFSLAPHSASRHDLHRDELFAGDETFFLSLPLLDRRRLAAVLTLASPLELDAGLATRVSRELAPVLQLLAGELCAAEKAERQQRNATLISSLGELFSAPHAPQTLLPQALKLFTGSGFTRCAIVRLTDEEGGPALFQSCRAEERPSLPAMLLAEPTLSARALAAGVTYCDNSNSCDPVGPAVSTPLCFSGRILGAATFFGRPEITSAEEVELAETVTRLLSCALAEAACSASLADFVRENDHKLNELSFLYRLSNTMLSTLKLNKLIHLTLTALTSGPTPFFDRAMLFLVNQRSGMLAGMLGVTSETSPSLPLPQGGSDDLLASRWDISDEEMAAQKETEFCRQVMGKRLELDGSLNVVSQAVLEKRLIYVPAELGDKDLLQARGPALAASPLIAHGEVVGAVLVDNALTKTPMSQEKLRFLQLFANQAGMAIENAMLYRRIEDAHQQLSEAQDNLLQKERLATIGEMAAGIAHELKGPLVSIGGFAGRLTKKLPQDSAEWAHADLIVREVVRLEGILSEILLFSKKTTICYTRCNLSDIVSESLAVVAPPIEEKGIEVATKFPRHKLVLLGDAQQLKQVFINILLNALDAMGEGGKLGISLGTTELEEKEALWVKVSDTGGGIPLEALNSIFTPFYTTKERGTGLGLPIANRIITNHGGKIHIHNNPGLGVEFRVVLPKHW
ncbi:ATP-binding protein [Geomonas sp. Red32]|uniref:ATP-binding protein n=1 Tax=Geomonas sp. Red32 TaxID=2912856 RepID=UPI00202CD0BD|nr:ATP-binding protein [Geomonas sp. Red32]MCM0080709.1 ATP-binding protein [Geomonas sp. Red32]